VKQGDQQYQQDSLLDVLALSVGKQSHMYLVLS